MINRIVLIGNGFDLAHGLKTSYKNFIDWYWDQKIEELKNCHEYMKRDTLCNFILNDSLTTWSEVALANPDTFNSEIHGRDKIRNVFFTVKRFAKFIPTTFFAAICKDIETKNWVDIENVYYKILCYLSKDNDDKKSPNIDSLNEEMDYLKTKLIEYLKSLGNGEIDENIKSYILSPIDKDDISIKCVKVWNDFLATRSHASYKDFIPYFKKYKIDNPKYGRVHPNDTDNGGYHIGIHHLFSSKIIEDKPHLRKPDNILILNFNYTHVADSYLDNNFFKTIHIHGDLQDSEKVIFGYGDELDDYFKKIENLNDNRYLKNVKSTCYMESSNYRKLMEFMNLAPYQVIIMGHSCGNSDRTLLHALFEHENCISIKPYYYVDNQENSHYTDMVQNIYRNFTNKANFRDKVVNIEFCKAMPRKDSK